MGFGFDTLPINADHDPFPKDGHHEIKEQLNAWMKRNYGPEFLSLVLPMPLVDGVPKWQRRAAEFGGARVVKVSVRLGSGVAVAG